MKNDTQKAIQEELAKSESESKCSDGSAKENMNKFISAHLEEQKKITYGDDEDEQEHSEFNDLRNSYNIRKVMDPFYMNYHDHRARNRQINQVNRQKSL